MSSDNPTPPDNAEVRRIWDANARWWDDRIGDGNQFQLELIEPATDRLLPPAPGQTILDIACGAGRMARRLAQRGQRVVACDFSAKFVERARQRGGPDAANIDYRILDATDAEQLRALGAQRFDGAVCTMGLMDMTTIEPLFATLPELLRPGGWFVFSIIHPCFQSPGVVKFAEAGDTPDGRSEVRNGVKITRYITPAAWKSEGIVGQPEPQYYFHRPMSALFTTAFAHGFVIDGFEEPSYAAAGPDDGKHLRWDRMPEITPVLVVRLRLANTGPAAVRLSADRQISEGQGE
jgi:2-polyprenyl-3-methyl-5-hydroxy-6-metoxy-1,4-benzoquinol methylase